MNSSKTLFQNAVNELLGVYPDREAQSIIFILFENFYGLRRIDVMMDKAIADFDQVKYNQAIERLKKAEPIQYVLENAWFLDRQFYVNSSVLIPRNETEELVQMIISNHKNDSSLNIIDLGTGSGCIAISLKLALPNANVYALDISKEALEIAKKNAQNLGVEINFLNADMRVEISDLPTFDIVVSNPPYVTMSEKKVMNTNVLAYEPHLALFVEDTHPLEFYEAIADFGESRLNPQGKLYLEINEHLGPETATMLQQKGYSNVEIIQDIHSKNRMISASFKDNN